MGKKNYPGRAEIRKNLEKFRGAAANAFSACSLFLICTNAVFPMAAIASVRGLGMRESWIHCLLCVSSLIS